MALTPNQDITLGDTGTPTRTSPPVEKDRYEVIDEVGEGGIGRVMRAHDKRLNRTVAIKLLRKLSAEHEQRFFTEAELTARLEHPAIVPVHDVGRWHTGEPFYAMKLVTGDSLKEVVHRAGSLDGRLTLLPNVLTVCDAVAYAHSQGVIHRDLKPSNVMVGSFGETVVIDWGLARLGSEPQDPRSIVGTPYYMAPEQARGQTADARSDVYALGALLYEVLGGAAPFEGESDVLGKVANAPPVPLPPEVPAELVAIASKAMSKLPADRYLDARALGADLRRYLEGQLVGAHRYSFWQRLVRLAARNKPLTFALVALAVGAAFAFVRIVAERDTARAAELKAEHAQVTAEHARASAESRRDQLLYAQSKLWLEKDPTVAYAWLKSYAQTKSATPKALSLIAADALSRQVATQLVYGRKRVALSPDGHTLAGVKGDDIVVWTIESAVPRVLGKAGDKVAGLKFSADGHSLFSLEGPRLREWSVAGGGPATVVYEAREPLAGLLISGDQLVAGGELGSVWLREGAGFKLVAQRKSRIDHLSLEAGVLASGDVDGNFGAVRLGSAKELIAGWGEGLSQKNGRLSWGDTGGRLHLHDLKTGRTQVFEKEHEGQISSTLLTPDGRWVVSMGQDHALVIRDLKSGARRSYTQGDAWLLHAELSEDGTQVLTLGQDHAARLWDLETGTAWALLGHSAPFRTFGFMGESVVTGDAEGQVRIWRRPRARSRVLLDAHTSQYEEARALPDGRVVSAGEDGVLNVWNPVTSERVKLKETGSGGSLTVAGTRICNGGGGGAWVRSLDALTAPPLSLEDVGEVHQATLSKDGARVAVASADHTVRVFELPATKGRVLGSHDASAWHVAFSPDGRWLASAGDDLPIRVWPLGQGEALTLKGPEAISYDLQFSPDGKWLAAAGIDTAVHLWSVTNGFEPHVLRGHRAIVRGLAFSPDGARIATISDDVTARVWSLTDLAQPPLVLDHAEQGAAVVFAPGGQTLVTADGGGIWRWDLATGALLSVDREHRGLLSGLAVSADGTALISAAEDRTVRWWPGYFDSGGLPALEQYSSVELRDDVAASRE